MNSKIAEKKKLDIRSYGVELKMRKNTTKPYYYLAPLTQLVAAHIIDF